MLAAGQCEAALYGQRLRLPGSMREDTVSTEVGCGVGHGVQAGATWGRSSRADAANGSRREALALAAKGRLYTAQDGSSVALTGGSVMGRAGPQAFRFDSAYLAAILTAGLADGLTGHANVGLVRSRDSGSVATTWNVAVESAVTSHVDAGIEIYGDDRSRPWLGAGLRWAATPSLKVGAAHAVQSDNLRQRLWQLSLTAAF